MPGHVAQQGSGWMKPLPRQLGSNHRQPFSAASMPTSDHSYRSATGSERSDSGNEVERLLLGSSSRITAGWGSAAARSRPGKSIVVDQMAYRVQSSLWSAFAPPVAKRTSKGFRPAVPNS